MKTRPLIWLITVVLVAAALWWSQRPQPVERPASVEQGAPGAQPTPAARPAAARRTADENHYSPLENLEQLDLAQLEGARRSLDIAMYAFTDRYLAEAVLRAARRGVRVRVYRDRQQFEEEQHRAAQHGGESTTDMFRGEGNIQVRVKSSHELMHLKAYCVDGVLLRDGSANWSPTGLKRQDNNARFAADAAQVRAFEKLFEGLWARDNEVVQ